jgi:hypothetical protein
MDWWNPWQYGVWDQGVAPLDIANAILPYLAGNEASALGRWLYGQRHVDPWLEQQIGEGYNRPSTQAGSTSNWLSKLQGFGTNVLPSYYEGSPEANWLSSLTGAASNLGPNMTRMQQREWRSDLSRHMQEAPNDQMQALGNSLFNPTLTTPEFGQAAPLGNYLVNYRTKGGLVSNPWFT